MAAWSDDDTRHMREALALARAAGEAGEVPVGAVVLRNNEIVGRGANRPVADHDPSAHAEIVALRDAGKASGNYRLTNCDLFVTLEPCVMCMGAIFNARVRRLVFGAYDDKAGAAGSVIDLGGERRLANRLEINGGLCADESKGLLQAFFEARR